MQITVFGGTGFIGSHVVEQLLAAGLKPLCPVREGSDRSSLQSLPANTVTCDFSDSALASIMQDSDVVINCIAASAMAQSPARQRQVDVVLTGRLLQQAQKAGVNRFIQLSTVQVYGFSRPSTAIDENHPVCGDYAFNRIAIEREHHLLQLAAGSDTELLLLRPANAFGARDRNLDEMISLHRRGWFLCISRQAVFSAVHAGDIGRAMAFLAQAVKPQYRCYLLESSQLNWPQLKQALDAASGRKTRLLYLPARLMLALAWLCEALTPTGHQAVLDRFAVKVLSTQTLFDGSRLRQEGFDTVYPLQDALTDYFGGA